MKIHQKYTTECRQNETSVLLNRYQSVVLSKNVLNPYPRLLIPNLVYREAISLYEFEILAVSVMDLLVRHVYPVLSGYAKANIIFYMNKGVDGEIVKPLNKQAIPLTLENGMPIPKPELYSHILRSIALLLELYDGFSVNSIAIRIYFHESFTDPPKQQKEEFVFSDLSECLKLASGEIDVSNLPVKKLRSTNRKYLKHITILRKSGKTGLTPFLVADTETLFRDGTHVPYAIGVMMVIPGKELMVDRIDTYFTEDYSSKTFPTFEERSTKMLFSFIYRVENICRQNPTVKVIYFHNLGRFDGIIVLKHLALNHPKYKLKPLMRENILYEIAVYSRKGRLLFTFRDSLHLLSGRLDALAKNLCPELGPKGSICYDEIKPEILSTHKNQLLDYMKQDIILLGGVMRKFQEIYYQSYQADIVRKLTTASLALSLFREKYYDEKKHCIHIPNQNEDTFIRKGYYGGHTDAYTPYGENLYYYDVNSLYPFIMKEFPMPGGVPVWHSDLEGMELDSMFGFLEVYVECPKGLKKPFLPYRDKVGTLIFPTGAFVGVYYSEELKYARDLGYTIIPICGYIFKKMESPFKEYVNSLFESRSNAKKMGNEPLSLLYKLLMNALYGRFGINPKSTKTEMCNQSRRDSLFKREEFISETYIREDLYMVSYHTNPGKGPSYWEPPKNSAVQLAAAITASARIYMYKFLSREDCYYTDTDSIVLGNPLPDEDVSSSVLGKFKLEDQIVKGYFLAPKCYKYTPEGSEGKNDVFKFKGAGRNILTDQWFEEQYANPTRSLTGKVTSLFRTDWKDLKVKKYEGNTTLRLVSNKRMPLLDDDGRWISTDPINIEDLSCLNYIGTKVRTAFKKRCSLLENKNSALSQKIEELEKRAIRLQREVESRKKAQDLNTLEDKNTLEENLSSYNTQEVEDAQQKDQEKEEKPTRRTMFPDLYHQSLDRPGPPPRPLDDKISEEIEIENFFKTEAEAYRKKKRIEEDMIRMNQQEQNPRKTWTEEIKEEKAKVKEEINKVKEEKASRYRKNTSDIEVLSYMYPLDVLCEWFNKIHKRKKDPPN